jgi:hypothetical protein
MFSALKAGTAPPLDLRNVSSFRPLFDGASSSLKQRFPNWTRASSFPPLFDEFRRKRFVLLWRGSRERFGARGFHRRCDGHAKALTLIFDTVGDVLGGFTPLQGQSPRLTVVTI